MTVGTIDWTPSEPYLQRFGVAGVAVFGAFGAWVFWRHSLAGVGLEPEVARRIGVGLWSLAAACGVLGWAAPRWLRPLYIGLLAAGVPVGFLVSHLVLGLVFFGVMTPIGLVFRVCGRDVLERKMDRGAATYWQRRSPITDVARYYRQV